MSGKENAGVGSKPEELGVVSKTIGKKPQDAKGTPLNHEEWKGA